VPPSWGRPTKRLGVRLGARVPRWIERLGEARSSRLHRYAVAVEACAVVLLLWLVFGNAIAPSPFPLFLAAIVVAVSFGGLGPAVVATILGLGMSIVLFATPRPPQGGVTFADVVQLIVFVLVAALITALNLNLRTAQARAEASERRARLLAEASRVLASSLDVRETLHALASLAVPTVGDWCSIEIAEGPVVRRFAATSNAPAHRFDAAVAEAMRTREPLIIDADTPASGSVLVAPMLLRDTALGAVCFGRSDADLPGPDLVLARELARRTAVALENARLYQEIQQALRVRDEFLAATSHELRTPLAHVKGFVSTLQRTDVEWDESTRREFLAEIDRETDRLSRLITDLLDMTRLESTGLLPEDRVSTSVSSVVESGLSRVRDTIDTSRMTVEVPRDLPRISADASQIERVIANLVENAHKYAPGAAVTITAETSNGHVRIAVDDDGPGIPGADLEHIFDKFVRIRSAARQVPGAGLGLAICRRIVESHGGCIRAENRPSGGARFVVELPAEVVIADGVDPAAREVEANLRS